MKRLQLFLAVISFIAISLPTALIGQGTIKGILTDEAGDVLIGANVYVVEHELGATSDIDGAFMISDVPVGTVTLRISYIGYTEKTMTLDVQSGTNDIGSTMISQDALGLDEVVVSGVMDIVQDRRTPVAVSTITLSEIQAKGVGNVEFPEVMKNTPSIYVSNQTGFGDAQMFTRGFDQINTAFLLNGQPINGMEDGRMYWSNWSGMSDVATAVQVQRGLGSSKLAISSVGGTTNIVTRTVQNDEGGYARFMYGNDNYIKGTFSYSSGLKDKWAYSFLFDHWQAENKWADGTRGQGQNYFLSVGYKPNTKNTFNFLVTGAPQWHGQRWSQSQETLEETPKFNQHWGEFEGEWESERRNFYHKPVLNLSWENELSEKSQLSSVLYASFGRGGGTGPFGSTGNRVRTDAGGVDFDAIAANNAADTDGLGSFSGNYALRASMNNHQWYGNVTNFETNLSDQLNWSVGLDVRWYTGDHFRQFANLLGLDGWNDNFRHATRSSDAVQSQSFKPSPWTALFNFADEDQRIAYDYSEQINYGGFFTQLEYTSDVFTVFGQAAFSNQSYQREGRWADQGKSEKINKGGYNVKGGASYSFDDNNILFANAGFYSRQPFLDNIFTNIRYSNELLTAGNGEGVENEEVVGLEMGYKFNSNNFTANINAYSTSWGNRTRISLGTDDNGTPADDSDDFTLRSVERGLNQIHTGVELDLAYRVSNFRIKGYASFGDWTFDGVESVQVFNDDTGVEISNTSGLDNSGVHVPNAPQSSLGIGINYDISKDFNVYLDYNRYSNLYINNINFDSGDQFFSEDQGELDPYGLFDFGASYVAKVGDDNLMTIRANVYNLMNLEYLNQTDPFGFLNGNGTTWNLSVRYSF